jgi:hypothetical protein
MTMITILDRSVPPSARTCAHCDKPAWAETPRGLRCHDHAVSEVREAVAAGNCDWVPRVLRRRSR